MADKRISELTDIVTLQGTDELPIARPNTTTDNKTTATEIRTFVQSDMSVTAQAIGDIYNIHKITLKSGSGNAGIKAEYVVSLPGTEELHGEDEDGVLVAIVDVIGNMDYTALNVESEEFPEKISIKSVTANHMVSTIRFISKSTPMSFEVEQDILLWANDEIPDIEANKEYLIAICDRVAVMTLLRDLDPVVVNPIS